MTRTVSIIGKEDLRGEFRIHSLIGKDYHLHLPSGSVIGLT
ncbi:MAG: hypothetical protein PVI11_05405 [Candidatus Aminicenantes bacterium]